MQQHWTWIRRHLRWQSNLAEGGSTPSPIAETLARGWGDCTDLSLLLAALLARDGIASEPVLADVKPLDDIADAAIPVSRIDHALLYVPAIDRYVDPAIAGTRPVATGGDRRLALALRAGHPAAPVDVGRLGLVDIAGDAAPARPRRHPVGWRPEFPIGRDELLAEIAEATRSRCDADGDTPASAYPPSDCRRYFDRALPLCADEAGTALPDVLASRDAHDAELHVFYRCLLPPGFRSSRSR